MTGGKWLGRPQLEAEELEALYDARRARVRMSSRDPDAILLVARCTEDTAARARRAAPPERITR